MILLASASGFFATARTAAADAKATSPSVRTPVGFSDQGSDCRRSAKPRNYVEPIKHELNPFKGRGV
jgi:hypothetical protein